MSWVKNSLQTNKRGGRGGGGGGTGHLLETLGGKALSHFTSFIEEMYHHLIGMNKG